MDSPSHQAKPAREKRLQVDCMNCGEAVDITGKAAGERIFCPECKAEFVVALIDGHLDIEFLT
ncbi:MAG: hypothetical protein V1820_02750 [archaeon]